MLCLRAALLSAVFIILAAVPTHLAQAQPQPAASSIPGAEGHVAIFYQHSESENVQKVLDGFTKRFRDAFAAEPGLSIVEASTSYGETSAEVHQHCEKMHVNAYVYPYYRFSMDEKNATVLAALRIVDCYGVPFYGHAEMKSESRLFVNRSGEREIADMGNDLVDMLLADFKAYETAHAAKWQNLLKYGVAADPPNAAAGLFIGVFLRIPKDSSQPITAEIDYLRPDGLGAKAGLKEGDVIVSIDGAPLDLKRLSGLNIAEQMEKAHNIIVRRGQQQVSILLRTTASLTH